MRYFLVTFLIVSIATHAAFANRGRTPKDSSKKELVSKRKQMIDALRKDNQVIEETVLTIEEIQKQIAMSEKVVSTASTTRILVSLTAPFAFYLAKFPALDGAHKAARLTRIVAAVGGVTVFVGTSVIIDIQQDKLQELTILLTNEENALKQEHAANTAVLETI